MATVERLSENSRQGFEVLKQACIGLEGDLSRNLRWGCGHIYDETPVDIAVYVRNDPVNRIDPDGRFDVPFELGYLIQMGWTTPEAVAFSLSLPYVNGISGSGNPFLEAYAYYYLSALRNEDPFDWNPPGFFNGYADSNPDTFDVHADPGIPDNPVGVRATPGSDNRQRNGPECQPDVIRQMLSAWSLSGNGTGNEAGFVLSGTPANYTVGEVSYDNQKGSVNLSGQNIFAAFHVHPNSSLPGPSPHDIGEVNRLFTTKGISLTMYTITNRGLYSYDYATKETRQLTAGLDWTKPCSNRAFP